MKSLFLFILSFSVWGEFLFSSGSIINKSPVINADKFHSKSDNCNICHIVENEIYTVPEEMKWNYNLSEINFPVYSSSSLKAEIGQPSGSTKMCLSCHDGIIANDDKGGGTLSSHKKIGIDLSDDHPVSFKYDSFLAFKDGELYDPSTSLSGLGGTIAEDMLEEGKLECISCHQIHGDNLIKGLLIKSNDNSQLCLTCHKK